MTEHDEGTFEMLWNCAYCGTEKLLGLTHRHCPVCGARQDAAARYFPKQGEEVAVKDHVYCGADKICPACGNPSSAKSAFCANCGSPLDPAREAGRIQEPRLAPQQKAGQPKAKSPKAKSGLKKTIKAVVGGLVVAAIGLAAVTALWKEQVGVAVQGHSWTRQIGIEIYSEVRESKWCDQMPSDARSVTRSTEVRSHRKIPDGETCSTHRVDQGDGTYSQKRVCTPRYRQEPVYDDKCNYTVNRWVEQRMATASGNSLAQTPQWPVVQLAGDGTALGSERLGRRLENYQVMLLDTQGKQALCAVPMPLWSQMAVGSRWSADKRVVTGGLDCGSIRTPDVK